MAKGDPSPGRGLETHPHPIRGLPQPPKRDRSDRGRDRSAESVRSWRRDRSEDSYWGCWDPIKRRSESDSRSRNSSGSQSRNSLGASSVGSGSYPSGATSTDRSRELTNRSKDSRPPSRESERSIDQEDRRQPWERPKGQQFRSYRAPDGAQDFTSSEDEDKRQPRSPTRRSRTSTSSIRTPRICHDRDSGRDVRGKRIQEGHNWPVNPALAGRTTRNVAAADDNNGTHSGNSGNARGAQACKTDRASKIRGLHQTVVLSEAI